MYCLLKSLLLFYNRISMYFIFWIIFRNKKCKFIWRDGIWSTSEKIETECLDTMGLPAYLWEQRENVMYLNIFSTFF